MPSLAAGILVLIIAGLAAVIRRSGRSWVTTVFAILGVVLALILLGLYKYWEDFDVAREGNVRSSCMPEHCPPPREAGR